MEEKVYINKIRGSLVGGAIGDALGYPVEFMGYDYIIDKYGGKGITRFELNNGLALISDDTQMTLFTANGILNAYSYLKGHGIMRWPLSYIRDAYVEWYKTQYEEPSGIQNATCRLCEIDELYSERAPGTTCMGALRNIMYHKRVQNESKGCGGIMRVSPIALYGAVHNIGIEDTTLLACDAARITHQHPLGFLSAGIFAYFLYELVRKDDPIDMVWGKSTLKHGFEVLRSLKDDYSKENYAEQVGRYIDELQRGTEGVLDFVSNGLSDVDAIHQLGGGWTGEEAWYIALFCTMRHLDNFENAVCAAVNHSGDSDSTGAICGNLMGTIVGYDVIPDYYKSCLELRNVIEKMADEIVAGYIH